MAQLSLAELIVVNNAAERFEARWRKGEHPRIEPYLDGLPAGPRDELLKTLLQIEIELRKKTDDPASRSECERRFPSQSALVAAAFRGK